MPIKIAANLRTSSAHQTFHLSLAGMRTKLSSTKARRYYSKVKSRSDTSNTILPNFLMHKMGVPARHRILQSNSEMDSVY